MMAEEYFRGQFVVRRYFRKWRLYELQLADFGMRKVEVWRATFADRADAVNFVHTNMSHDEAFVHSAIQSLQGLA